MKLNSVNHLALVCRDMEDGENYLSAKILA
jgi:hypothetical protein